MIKSPFAELVPGEYSYMMPGWSQPRRVEAYISEGYLDGQLLIRFVAGYYGTPVRDIPALAMFSEPSPGDSPLIQTGYYK